MSQIQFTFLAFMGAMVLAYALSWAATAWSRRLALRLGIVSLVTNRSSHKIPTPRLGGLGLAIGYGVACALFLFVLWGLPHEGAWIAFLPARLKWIALGWALIVITGLLDDVFDLHAGVKFALMGLAALPPVLGADLAMPLPGDWLLPTPLAHGLELFAAWLWIMFFANAFNFMDGMDGFAATFAVYALITMFLTLLAQGLYHQMLTKIPLPFGGGVANAEEDARIGWLILPPVALGCWAALRRTLFFAGGFHRRGLTERWPVVAAFYGLFLFLGIALIIGRRHGLNVQIQIRGEAYLMPIIAIACWGFLKMNRPPANVFMGDGGSLGLGYLLGVFVLFGESGSMGRPFPLAAGLTILLPFLFDVLLTLVRRWRAGEKLWKAHREHLYQRLMRAGFSHDEVLLINIRRFAVCGAAGMVGALMGEHWMWTALAVALATMIDYWQRTVSLEKQLRAREIQPLETIPGSPPPEPKPAP